jgi:rubrerythrin
MPQEFSMQEALRLAIETEKAVMCFYEQAAKVSKDARASKVFTTLAGEEREHAGHFFKLYKGADLGDFEAYMAKKPDFESVMLHHLKKEITPDLTERKAMEIALKEEEDLAKNLAMTAERIVDPIVRAVFDRMVKETENHFAIIESEYAHMMGMVHETDIDTFVRE